MATNPSEQRPCPVCGASSVVQILPATIPVRKPSHNCESCGATFTTRLHRSGWISAGAGLLLMLVVFGLYELSGSIRSLSQSMRAIAALALLGGTSGFFASRVFRAIELVLLNEGSQSAAIYRFKDRFLVHPSCRTTDGVWLSCSPFVALPLDASNHDLGIALGNALSFSGNVVAHPKDWKAVAAPRLAAAGVKSEAAFQRESAHVQVQASGNSLSLCPTHNGGATGDARGFHFLPAAEIRLSLPMEPEALGAQVRKAFEQCTD